MKVMKKSCATCPFRPGSEYTYLVPDLTACALTKKSRICHSTGNNPVIKRVKVPPAICRGSRDVQLQVFYRLGVIAEPTDKAWEEAWNKMKKK